MGCAQGNQSGDFGLRYTSEELIYRGSFGEVRRCVERRTKKELAVKTIKAESVKEKVKANRERSTWEGIGECENIVRFVESFSDSSCIYLVMERCDLDLAAMVEQHRQHSAACCMQVVHQIIAALKHCHARKIVHRDIQLSNVLVGFDGIVKICDFGNAANLPSGGFIGIMGNAAYMSPEMVQFKYYKGKTDVWSCGVIAYKMLYGNFPYCPCSDDIDDTDTKTMVAIRDDSPGPKYEVEHGLPQVSEAVQEFVQCLLMRESSRRPDASGCLKFEIMSLISNFECQPPYASIGASDKTALLGSENADSSMSTRCTGMSQSLCQL